MTGMTALRSSRSKFRAWPGHSKQRHQPQIGLNMKTNAICLDQVPPPRSPRDVTVKRLYFDWNDPSEAVVREIERIGDSWQHGCWYINPISRVYGPEPTRVFLSVVRKRQAAWFRMLNRQFGSGWRRKMLARSTGIVQRRYEFTGILVVDGNVIEPDSQANLERRLGLHRPSDRNRRR